MDALALALYAQASKVWIKAWTGRKIALVLVVVSSVVVARGRGMKGFPGIKFQDGHYKAQLRLRGKTVHVGMASSVIEAAGLILDYYDSVGVKVPKQLFVRYDELLQRKAVSDEG